MRSRLAEQFMAQGEQAKLHPEPSDMGYIVVYATLTAASRAVVAVALEADDWTALQLRGLTMSRRDNETRLA